MSLNPKLGKGRTASTIQNDLMKAFPYFIKESQNVTSNSSRVWTKDFSVITILKLLSPVNHCDMTMSELYRASNIAMKRSYLNYLRMCVNFELLTKESRHSYSYYHITEKGKIFLELFRK